MIAKEALLFLRSCLLGAGFGVVYDGFRILRLFLPSGEKITFIEDGLFFLILSAANFLFFLSHTYGELRLFLLIGEALGFSIYYLTAGRAVYFLMLHLSKGVKRLFRRLFRLTAKLLGIIAYNSGNKTVNNNENDANRIDS